MFLRTAQHNVFKSCNLILKSTIVTSVLHTNRAKLEVFGDPTFPKPNIVPFGLRELLRRPTQTMIEEHNPIDLGPLLTSFDKRVVRANTYHLRTRCSLPILGFKILSKD